MSSTKDADDQEVFEIQDYTTASEWERFTANVEEVLHDWQLTSSDRKHSSPEIDLRTSALFEWQEKSMTIKFSDYAFKITHHFMTYNYVEQESASEASKEEKDEDELPQYLHDILNLNNDFPGKAHCLVRWYGLREFLTLTPAVSTQPITSPSKAKVVLSSLAMAANNTNCEVPLFLQVNDLADKVYLGVGFGNDVRTDFEMAYIKTPPPQCTHLSGLLDVFKSKIGISLSSDPVLVSIRFTYVLSDWPHTLWSQQPPDFDSALSEVGFSELGRLPFGALSDPVSELHVSTTWPCVSEYSLMDSDAQSDLSPSSAPLWSARLGSSFASLCLLAEHLADFIRMCECKQSMVYILGPGFDPAVDDGANILNALDRLTGSPISTSFPSPAAWRGHSKFSVNAEQGPIGEETLSLLLNFLFPDAQSVQEEFAPYSSTSSSLVPPWKPLVEGLMVEHPLKNALKTMKSCDVDSFVWRLSVVLCHVMHSLGGQSSVAHFFYEVLMELRFRWDNGILIPGLAEGSPDMAFCIIYQKLQMLNCCIRHRIAREDNVAASSELEDDDEFYECDEDMETETERETEREMSKGYSSWDKPEGRLKRFGKAMLLRRKDYIYVPVTQEAAPNTEDMLEEQTGELLRLGSDASGSCQRAKLMSTSLLSDMESFKAANPGSVLEDFVRWYSPRDWVEEEEEERKGGKEKKKKEEEERGRGHLSARMLIPGNLWKEVWENAKPVPARRQKRLFDDTREAQKVLSWFTSLSPGRLCHDLLPVVMHASLCRLAEEPVVYTLSALKDEVLPRPLHEDSLAAQVELLAKRMSRLSRQPSSIQQYKSIYVQIETIERYVAKAQSLRLKFLGHTVVSPASLKKMYSTSDSESVTPGNDDLESAGSSNSKGGDNPRPPRESNTLSPLENLVTKLLQHSEVALEGGSKGLQASVIKKLFSEALSSIYLEEIPEENPDSKPGHPHLASSVLRPMSHGKCESSRDMELGKPAGREYLLRTHASLPADHSRRFPQRLYAVVQKKAFRMAGAISQDTLFC